MSSQIFCSDKTSNTTGQSCHNVIFPPGQMKTWEIFIDQPIHPFVPSCFNHLILSFGMKVDLDLS